MPAKFNALAEYNARCSQGIVHMPEYEAMMRRLQAEYDAWLEDEVLTHLEKPRRWRPRIMRRKS